MGLGFDVINFHLLEACNYKCTYCFAVFNQRKGLSKKEWFHAVDNVKSYFNRNNIKKGRINLAGGEPMLLSYLNELIDYIYSLDIDVSIITNASKLTKEHIDLWQGKVSILGVSIDSLKEETNMIIGRNQNGNLLNIDSLSDILNYAKTKGMKLKINTVVSKLNSNEDISVFYDRVSFDRIKLLQMRVNENCNGDSKKLSVTKNEFNMYCNKLKNKYKTIIEPEDEIESSYVVIDPKGYLIANSSNLHKKVGSIFEYSLEELIESANLNYKVFSKRYL